MPVYNPPSDDIKFVLHDVLNATQLSELPGYEEVSEDLMDQILEEGGKICSEVLFPLNQSGDQEGCHYENGVVRTPKGFKEAYDTFSEGGWCGLSADPEFGGMGMPVLMNTVMQEMICSANMSFGMYPGLSQGCYEALHHFGTDEQKALYLPKLIEGIWSGTMCLTEPHCGTDLGLIKTKADPNDDGSYHITGTKIFISAGEHDLTENIVHLVLAKLPDAPEGVRGISLFVVPKFLPKEDGSVGERNGVRCGSIEHKMGIHANSTCVMNFDGAQGWLVGEPHKGLRAMFVLMNAARLGVGMQGLGICEVAYQNGLMYAKDRLQMRSITGTKAPDKPADPIIVHPDVRRMLLKSKAVTEAGRALAYWTGLKLDISQRHPDEQVRQEADDLVALLTPIVKAYLTDMGTEIGNECMQVYGGHGYIAEWGMEQYVRDSRINMIYDGTNTIQSLDLLGRKVLGDGGAKLMKFGKMVRALCEAEANNPVMKEFVEPLADLGDKVSKLTMEIGGKAMQNPDEVGAAAVDYLRVVGHLFYGYFFAQAAKIALEKQASGDKFYTAKLHTARFYFQKMLPETAMLIRKARAGSSSLMEMEADLF